MPGRDIYGAVTWEDDQDMVSEREKKIAEEFGEHKLIHVGRREIHMCENVTIDVFMEKF